MKTFEQIGQEIGKLVQEKNAAYGDSFARSGEIMRILFPNGIKPEQVDDALAIVRVLDKLFRVATAKDALGESPWLDLAGYGILGAARAEREKSTLTSGRGGFSSVTQGSCVQCHHIAQINSEGWCFDCFSEPTKPSEPETREPVKVAL